MTIYQTAFETTQCEGFGPAVTKTQAKLKAAQAMGALNPLSPDMLLVMDGDTFRDAIPGFTHPMLVDPTQLERGVGKPVLAMDVRPFGGWNRNQAMFTIRNNAEMDMAVLRLRLNALWLNGNQNYLRTISAIPAKMFSSWLRESITRKFGLEPLEQMNIAILAGIFYHSNFSNETELDEAARTRVAATLNRELGIAVNDILPVVDRFPTIASIDAFCKAAAELGGVRLKELNRGLVYASLGGSWFGYNFKEVLAVALEHPPTWLAIVFTAGRDRSFRSTRLSKMFEDCSRGGADQLFFSSLKKLLDNLAPADSLNP